MIYPPQEDSELLARFVGRLARGRVLDMGAGSGIQAKTAAGIKRVKSVLAVDIDEEAVRHCRKSVAGKKIRCLQSDLFSRVPKDRFDTIIFNPPYLPQELRERDIALEGGKQGFETIRDFLFQANPFLAAEGRILLLFSSLSRKHEIERFIRQQLFSCRELGRLHVFFEDLFVYEVAKSALLKRVEKAGVSDARFFARGGRSWVYRGIYRKKHCIVKVRRPDSAVNSGLKEGRVLKVVNRLGLGPRLLLAERDFVVYEYVPGIYVEGALNRRSRRGIFRQLFEQAFILDRAGLAKEEMLRPLRNAVVTPRGRVVLIDFERTHKSGRPGNVTQLCTFAAQKGIAPLSEVRHWARHYKKNPTRGNFQALLKGIGL